MITVSAGFKNLLGRNRGPFRIVLRVYWNGHDPVDESARLLSINYTQAVAKFTDDMLPTGNTDECTLILRNHEWRYSPLHTGGDNDVRPYISGPLGVYGKYFELDYELIVDDVPEPCRLFTGYLFSVTPSDLDQQVTFTGRDAGQLILQKKLDSFTQRNLSYSDAMQYVYGLSERVTSWRLDSLPLRLPWVYMDNEGAITQCQNIAAAIAGFFYHDAFGIPCFRALHQQLANRDADYAALPLTFTSLDIGQDTERLASDIRVTYQPRTIGPPDVVYETEAYYTILPLETRTITLRLNSPLYYAFEVDGRDYVIDNHSGRSMVDVVDVGVLVSGQRVTVTLHNNHSSLAARLVYLRIRGVPLNSALTGEVEKQIATTTLPPKERVRTVEGEFYIQTYAVADYVAANVAALFGVVPYNYVLNSFQGWPWLELLDPVTFYDSKLVSVARYGYIVQIQTSWTLPSEMASDSVFQQTLYVADTPAALKNNNFFIVGVSSMSGTVPVTWH